MTPDEAVRVDPDGYQTIVAASWSHINTGDGYMVTVTPSARACGCGKGLACELNGRERVR